MGGIGSGRWCRWDNKATLEDLHKINIHSLQKKNLLKQPGSTGNLSWFSDREKVGSINFFVGEEYMVLLYSHSSYGGESQKVKEIVKFDWTPCNYGGERVWFLCPQCVKRVAVLYCSSGRFLCRHCSNLRYGSQNEVYIDSMMRKARKIRCRLGASQDLTEPVWDKPKGMHWETFNCLVMEEEKANQASNKAIAEKLGMFI